MKRVRLRPVSPTVVFGLLLLAAGNFVDAAVTWYRLGSLAALPFLIAGSTCVFVGSVHGLLGDNRSAEELGRLITHYRISRQAFEQACLDLEDRILKAKARPPETNTKDLS